jgi:hypothetical protein
MSLGAAIFGRLSTDTIITEIVSDRIYPSEAPQEEKKYPRLVYELTEAGKDPNPSYDGPGSLLLGGFTVACIALDPSTARGLAAAVLTSLDGQEGSWGSVSVETCFAEGYQEEPIALDLGQDRIEYVIEREFSIWFSAGGGTEGTG